MKTFRNLEVGDVVKVLKVYDLQDGCSHWVYSEDEIFHVVAKNEYDRGIFDIGLSYTVKTLDEKEKKYLIWHDDFVSTVSKEKVFQHIMES